MSEKWEHLLREGSLDDWEEVEEEGICLLQGWTDLLETAVSCMRSWGLRLRWNAGFIYKKAASLQTIPPYKHQICVEQLTCTMCRRNNKLISIFFNKDIVAVLFFLTFSAEYRSLLKLILHMIVTSIAEFGWTFSVYTVGLIDR